MLWAYRRDLKKAALLCLGTVVPMGLAYVVWQPTAFGQVLRNGTLRVRRLLGQSRLPLPRTVRG